MSQDTVNYIDVTDLFYPEDQLLSGSGGSPLNIKEIRKVFDEVVKDNFVFDEKDYCFSVMVTDDDITKICVTTFLPIAVLQEPLIVAALKFCPLYKEKGVEYFIAKADGEVEFYYMATDGDEESV